MRGDKVQPFYLLRKEDVSGTSGVGVVAYGAKFPSGHCMLEWASNHVSWEFLQNIEEIEKLHGHGGKTTVVMGNPPEKDKVKK
jgi:hypothetical protein